MAHDPDLDPIFAAINNRLKALEDGHVALAARVTALEGHAPPAPNPQPPAPQPSTFNRKMIGLAIPDGELANSLSTKISQITALGFPMVRMDVRYETERDSGMNAYAARIDALRAKGIDVLAILGGNHKASTTTSREAFVRYVERAVTWLKARGVNHIQWWNEPNHATRAMSPQDYAAAIRLAYPAAKAINPDLFAVAAGLSAIPSSENGHISVIDWLRDSYAAGAKGHYDAQAVHPYSYPHMLDNGTDWTGWGLMIRRMKPYMDANGEGHLKIWATEAGFPTDGSGDHTEANQKTRYADRLVAEMDKHSWLGPVFHYSLIDRDATTARESRFGILNSNGSQKPAYNALKSAIAEYVTGA